VASEHCDACGFDGARYDEGSLVDALRAQGAYWRALLAPAATALILRPDLNTSGPPQDGLLLSKCALPRQPGQQHLNGRCHLAPGCERAQESSGLRLVGARAMCQMSVIGSESGPSAICGL
jgi:hypothetical protein